MRPGEDTPESLHRDKKQQYTNGNIPKLLLNMELVADKRTIQGRLQKGD